MGPGDLQNSEEMTAPPLPEGHGNFASPLVPGYTGRQLKRDIAIWLNM